MDNFTETIHELLSDPKPMTFRQVRDEINELWNQYGDELGDLLVKMTDEDGIVAMHVSSVETAGHLAIIGIGEFPDE